MFAERRQGIGATVTAYYRRWPTVFLRAKKFTLFPHGRFVIFLFHHTLGTEQATEVPHDPVPLTKGTVKPEDPCLFLLSPVKNPPSKIFFFFSHNFFFLFFYFYFYFYLGLYLTTLCRLPIMPRRKRDAHEPKRAMTAYMLFCQEKRAEVKEKNPEVGFGQIGKLLGEAWKELDTEEKAVSSS